MFPKNVKENELGIDPEKCYAKCTKNDKRRSCLWIKYSMRVIYESKKKAADWEEAVRKAGAVLVEEGSIRPAYVEKMIQSVKELGPYIVIMPGFALAHAAPCEDVVKSDMALITLDTPVEFGSPNDPVSVLLCLGCTDSTSHLDTLSRVAETLLAEERIDMIAKADSVEEVVRIMAGKEMPA